MGAREDLISATIELIRSRGVASTGIADIVEASGRSRRTIYLTFPDGKEELVDVATKAAGHYIESLIATSSSSSAAGEHTGFVRKAASFWRTALHASKFQSGCPIVAAALGRHDAPRAADSAGAIFERWINLLTDALTERTTADRTTARSQAITIIAAIEGAMIISQAMQTDIPINAIETTLEALLPTENTTARPPSERSVPTLNSTISIT